jgi:hypothetical protein
METEKELSETTKRCSRIGCLKVIGWGLLILALLAILGVFWNRTKMQSRLQKTLAEMDRSEPGWRWEDIEAARAEVPEEENSARIIVAAAEQMPQPWPSAGFPSDRLGSLPPNEMLSGEDFVRLSKELADARPALRDVERVADMPRGRHSFHLERNPIATLLPHLQQCRNLLTLLTYESMRRNQKGDSKGALTACRTALHVARSIGEEPFYVSHLVRIACCVHVCLAIERTLGQGEPSAEDLTVFQKLIETEDAFPALLSATRGERAALHKVFEGIERGELSAIELESLSSGSRHSQSGRLKDTLISLWRMDTREDHALFLSLMTQYVKAAQLPMHEQAAVEKKIEQEVRTQVAINTLPGTTAMITRLLLPAMSKMGEAFRREHAYLRCMIVALAAERYRREKKTWPENIDQLCPRFLAAALLDPFDAKPLRYRRVQDGVIIYSVGQDVTDNGGNLDRDRPTSPGVDFGFRLWDVNMRRQPPKPKPDQPPQGPIPPS